MSMKGIQTEERYLIKLLASILKGENPPKPPRSLNWNRFYNVAKIHDVANMVYYALIEMKGKTPRKAFDRFSDEFKQGVVTQAVQNIEVKALLEELTRQGIKCLPIKGFIIKYLYPNPDMRFLSDVDILIDDVNLPAIRKIMASMGYSPDGATVNSERFVKPPVANIEFHKSLIPPIYSNYYNYFSLFWVRAKLKSQDKKVYELSNDDYYIVMLAYLANRYRTGDAGIRSVMDIWVYLARYGTTLNREYISEELKKIKLLKFSQQIEKLAGVWFDNQKSDPLLDEMTAYIVSNSKYILNKTARLNAIQGEEPEQSADIVYKEKKVKYFFWRHCPNLKYMKAFYPWLEGKAFLLPLAWIMRSVKLKKKKNVKPPKQEEITLDVKQEDEVKTNALLEKMGL